MPLEPRRRFRFLQEISEGSFGKVYLAEMITGENFSTIVAIKLLHGKWLGHEEIVMRSRDEARLLGLLRHQNIIRVEDLTSLNGQCAVVMEYIDGVDLKTLISFLSERNTLFPRHTAAEIAGSIAAALEAAYNHRPLQGGEPLRVIHRDIKPSNVMVTTAGEVKVLDFGTARANFQDREAQTQALAFGSQAYMAPERKEGEPDSPAGDIFSLGVTLYEMLSLERFGTIYIREERYRSTLLQNVGALDLTAWPEPVAEDFRAFLFRMMDYRPENRPPAADVIEAMEDWAEKANDLALRRFSRRFVTEAVSRREPLRTPGDPLTGSTLVEDASSAFTSTVREDEIVSGPFPQHDEPHGSLRGAATVTFEELPPEPPQALEAPPHDPAEPGAQESQTPPARTWDGWAGVEPPPPVAAPEPVVPEPPPPVAAPEPVVPEPPPPVAVPEPVLAEPPPIALEAPAPVEPVDAPPPPPVAEPEPQVVEPEPPVEEDEALPPEPETPAAPEASPEQEPPEPAPLPFTPPVAGAFDRDPVEAPDDEPTPRKSGGLKFMLIGLAAVLLVGGGGAVVLLPRLGGGEPGAEPATSVAGDTETPTASPAAPPPATGPVGTIVLRTVPPGGAVVTTTHALSNYRDVWDGSGQRVLAGMPTGTYRTRLKFPSGSSVRSTLEVQADKTCSFTFDLSSGSDEWISDGCE